ncbi:Holliday junction resolvase RecU [Brevibacillus ginsengisoli]|uniref:Holliday junction resolvase RecU n=1 Tax=Brevibacillus ginsengisoli TaxID=363854 RepID=UPI003CE97606
MKVSQANRGQAFEQLLNLTNQQYEAKGIALIHKRPTPVKVLRTRGNLITNAVYDKKSTVDYDGTYKGRAIYFEAKSTREKNRFDLKNIERHQLEHLEKAEHNGAICFFLIEFASYNEVYFVPLSTIRHYFIHVNNGGRKSIPREDFEYYAYEVTKSKRALLDYLVYVDRMIGDGAA